MEVWTRDDRFTCIILSDLGITLDKQPVSFTTGGSALKLTECSGFKRSVCCYDDGEPNHSQLPTADGSANCFKSKYTCKASLVNWIFTMVQILQLAILHGGIGGMQIRSISNTNFQLNCRTFGRLRRRSGITLMQILKITFDENSYKLLLIIPRWTVWFILNRWVSVIDRQLVLQINGNF
jgi:hypothetical protein